ncbi:MAG: class 1 fructose-bisphosphatase [Myxococcota bacterium]
MEATNSWGPPDISSPGNTLERHVALRQRRHPYATGELTGLFGQISLAAKIIQREVNRAGLAGSLGLTGAKNVQGEEVQKLDEFANATLENCVGSGGHVCVMGSEERENPIIVPAESVGGKYVLLFDPLDGSGNIDINASIGTIFSIYRRKTETGPGKLEDLLQPGRDLVAAGYVIYGSSCMLVYSAGEGVHGFTLDPAIGEFFLSHGDLKIPERGHFYSINEGYSSLWDEATRRWVRWIKSTDPSTGRPYSLRYIGAMVADLHRTLLRGGIFAYPGDSKHPNGKLRLLYEAAPMAFVVEAAGGLASSGESQIRDIVPDTLHQRTPLFIGSPRDVEDALNIIQESQDASTATG